MDHEPGRPRRRGIYLLPNLFTTAALFAGFYSIVAAMNARFESAAVAIVVAMVLDGLDGRVARLTNPDPKFVGVSVNTSRLSESEAGNLLAGIGAETGLPAVDPLRGDGVAPIVERLVALDA